MLEQYDLERRAWEAADAALLQASEPPPSLDLIEWAEGNVRIPDGPRAGRLFDLSFTPYLGPILKRLSPEHGCTKIVVRKSAQVGYTLVLICWMLAIIARIGGKGMIVQPTLPAARDFNEEKFHPAIEECDPAFDRLDEAESKASLKKFPGGSIRLTGANSSKDLRSKTIKWMGCDEVDDWPRDLDGQGDPMGMVDARQFSYIATGEYKKLVGSTPTIEGASRIDADFERGEQVYWEVPCPHCGEFQQLVWEQLRYKEDWPHEAEYECLHCGVLIPHHEKERMVRAGRESAPRNPGPGRYFSYEIDALLSPLVTWDAMVAAYIEAKDDPLTLKTWTNMWRGRSFKLAGEAPGWRDLMERAQRNKIAKRGQVPDWALFITAGADVQKNRIEITLYGWGLGKTRIGFDKIVLEGDTADLGVWARLTEFWQQEFFTVSGFSRRIEMLAIDAGYLPDMVCNWVRGKELAPRGQPRAMAVRGTSRVTDWILGSAKKRDFTAPGTQTRRAVMVWWVGSYIGKASFYGFLGLKGPNEAGQFPAGYVHFAEDFDEDFYKQATAETMRPIEKRNGRVDYEWILPAGTRNEVLDCSVYAHAAAIQLGIDKLTPEQWAALHQERTQAAPDRGQLDLLSAVVAPPAKDKPAEKPPASIAKRLA